MGNITNYKGDTVRPSKVLYMHGRVIYEKDFQHLIFREL
jgi:hypothetical protein